MKTKRDKIITILENVYGRHGQVFITQWKMEESAKRICKLKSRSKQMVNTKINLCETCKNNFATCKSNPYFGNGKGNDNVIQCLKYAYNERHE